MSITNKKHTSIVFFSLSIISILCAFGYADSGDIVNINEQNLEQLKANKKPIIKPITADIQQLKLALNLTGQQYINLQFKFSDKAEIAIEQPKSGIRRNSFNIDVSKIDWKTQSDTLTLTLDKALTTEEDARYLYRTLVIRLPKQINHIDIDGNIANSSSFNNQGSPIDLTVVNYVNIFSGNFNQLTVTEPRRVNDNIVRHRDTEFNIVNIQQLDIERVPVQKGDASRKPAINFSRYANIDTINIKSPKFLTVEIDNLALINRVNWQPVLDIDKKAVVKSP